MGRLDRERSRAGKISSVDGVIRGIRWGLCYSYLIYHMNMIIIYKGCVCVCTAIHVFIQEPCKCLHFCCMEIQLLLRCGMQSFIICLCERKQHCIGFLLRVA